MNKKTKVVVIQMILFTGLLLILTLMFFFLYRRCQAGWMLSVTITMLTIFYHFAMRLIVGEVITLAYRGKEFPQDKLGFRIYGFEKELYKKWKVQKWKANTITAKPEQFDLNQVSPEELLHNVMQAELVHRIIMVLSFVPLLFIIPFGVPVVFIATSVFACLIDLSFVVIQRYNRPRVIKLLALWKRRKKTF